MSASPARARAKRMSKRSLMVIAGAAAAAGFALPWVTIQLLPKSVTTAGPQVIVVSKRGQVVSTGSTTTGTGVAVAPVGNAPAVTTTRASAPAPPGV